MNIDDFITKKYLDKGEYGTCYLLDNGNVLKIFKDPRSLKDIDKFKYFLNYENDSCVFPFEFIYDNKNFYGYIMKYARGSKLNECFSKSNLFDLSKNSIRLQKDIDFISEGHIELSDIHSENVIYDGNKYSIIDHDLNFIGNSSNVTRESNRNNHRILIRNLFVENIPNNKYTKIVLDKINKYSHLQIFPSEMIVTIKEDLEKEFKEKIDTLDDIDKIIKGR